MTPTDPELVTRLIADTRAASALAGSGFAHISASFLGHIADTLETLQAALDAARQRDAELEAGALELSGALNKALTRERLLCDQLDTAEARVQQLEAALKAYGKHPANCPKGVGIGHYVPSVDAKCNCGIDAALGRADTPEPPHED